MTLFSQTGGEEGIIRLWPCGKDWTPATAHGLTLQTTTGYFLLESVSHLVAAEDTSNITWVMKLSPTTVCILSVFGIVLFQVSFQLVKRLPLSTYFSLTLKPKHF